jgi:hypothetical protein
MYDGGGKYQTKKLGQNRHCAVYAAGLLLWQKLIDRQYQSYPNPKKAITVSFVRSNYRKKNQTKSNISQLLF